MCEIGEVDLRVELGWQLFALYRLWAHAELEEVPVGDVCARWLPEDDRVAQYRRAKRVWILPDEVGRQKTAVASFR